MKFLLTFALLIPITASAQGLLGLIYERWVSVVGIKKINPELQLSGSIKKPEGTWQALLEVYYLDSNFLKLKDCLSYYVPLGKDPGILKVQTVRLNQNCENVLLEAGDATEKGIYNLAIKLSNSAESKYHLRIKMDKTEYDFIFPNMNVGNHFSGIQVGVPSTMTSSRIPNLRDGMICFDVDNECSVKMEYRCNQCINSSYQVIASNCSTAYRQVCGPDNCGGKNQPACIRGRKSTGFELDYCINDSPVGFCNKGLRVMCFDKVLICQ